MIYNDHIELGTAHAMEGLPRYKFQDPVLQQHYDRGYDAVFSERRTRHELHNEFARLLGRQKGY